MRLFLPLSTCRSSKKPSGSQIVCQCGMSQADTLASGAQVSCAGTAECDPGSTGEAGSCTACAAGKYKTAAGPDACTECSAGKYSSAVGATSDSTCSACPANSSSPAASSTLTACTCPAGYTGPDGEACSECGAGKYKTAAGSNATACSDCAVGQYQEMTGASACLTCADGATSFEKGTQCFCLIGYSGDPSIRCTACPPGQYWEPTELINLARACVSGACPASMSSFAYGGHGGRAVDGNDGGGYWNSGTCIHTNTENYPWLRIDLQRIAYTSFIRIYNRRDHHYANRLDGFEIRVGYSDIYSENEICASNQPYPNWIDQYPCTSGRPIRGRYVWILVPKASAVINLCEVEVHGFLESGSIGTCANCSVGQSSTPAAMYCLDCAAGTDATHAGSSACNECRAGKYKTAAGTDACTECSAGKYSSTVGATMCSACPANSNSPAASSTLTACKCSANLPRPFWPYSMLQFRRVYAYWPDQQSKSAWEKLDSHGPHALCHDEARDLHRFGSYVTGHLPRSHPLVDNETLDDRALDGVWLGNDLTTPMFWMYSFKLRKVVRLSDPRHFDHILPFLCPDDIPHRIDLSADDICTMHEEDGDKVERMPVRKSTRFRVTASGEPMLVPPTSDAPDVDSGENSGEPDTGEPDAWEQDSG